VFTIDAHSHWTCCHCAGTVPMRLFDASRNGNAFLATFVANDLRGAFPLLDLLAICLVRAMVAFCCNDDGWKCCVFTSVQVMVDFFVLPVRCARTKNFRSPFTHRYFCIFNLHHEEVQTILLVYAMYMLY
jgi:hypothetical protein